MKTEPSFQSSDDKSFMVSTISAGRYDLTKLMYPTVAEDEINEQFFDNAYKEIFSKKNRFFATNGFMSWHLFKCLDEFLVILGLLGCFLFGFAVITSELSLYFFSIILIFLPTLFLLFKDLTTHNLFKKMDVDFKRKNKEDMQKILYIFSVILNNKKYPFSEDFKKEFLTNILENFPKYTKNDFNSRYIALFNEINIQIKNEKNIGFKSFNDLKDTKNAANNYCWSREQELFLKENIKFDSSLEINYEFENKSLLDCLIDAPFISQENANKFILKTSQDLGVYKLDKTSFKENLFSLCILLKSNYCNFNRNEKINRVLSFIKTSYSFENQEWKTNKDLVFLMSLQAHKNDEIKKKLGENEKVSQIDPFAIDLSEMQKTLFFK